MLRRKNDEWMKNWMTGMKWYGAQTHDISMGIPTKKASFREISLDFWLKPLSPEAFGIFF